MSTRLSVNINKIATLRNARGENNPDVLRTALDLEQMGADGITVHPRPDERHIRRADVRQLSGALGVEFNIEGYPAEEFLRLVEEAGPAQATLVPDAPGALTSSAGWDVEAHADFLRGVVARLRRRGIRVSLFVAADPRQVRAAAAVGADRVELYTKPYADGYAADRAAAVAPFVEAARAARAAGLGLNAGHDLSLENLAYFRRQIPWLDEVSIGHALICDALQRGLRDTVRLYQQALGKKTAFVDERDK